MGGLLGNKLEEVSSLVYFNVKCKIDMEACSFEMDESYTVESYIQYLPKGPGTFSKNYEKP